MKEPRGRRGSGVRAWKPSEWSCPVKLDLEGESLAGFEGWEGHEGKEMYFLSSSRKYVILS